MRPLEAVFVAAVFAALALRWSRPRNRQATTSILGMLVMVLVLHFGFDGIRWEMMPAYALGAVGIWILSQDLRRLSGAKAGESSRWRAVPGPMQRAGYGAALIVAGVIAASLPGWLLPRVKFQRLAGFYDVGRVDVFWVDSTRDESMTQDPTDKRGLWITIWYPAESPAGRRVRYHNEPGLLAADLAAATSYPSFTFRNLTRARTRSTGGPRFSIREGRSPLVLFSHHVGGTRVESTFAVEELASHGYVVAGIDHTFSSSGVRLPDGSHANDRRSRPVSNDTSAANQLDVWTADARFVLDRFNRLPAGDASDSVAGHLQLDRVGYMGRGTGASVAAEMLAHDARVKAGVGLDGDFVGSAATTGLRLPFLVFTPMEPSAVSESRIASLLKFGGTEIRMEGAVPANFSDLPLWSPWLARRRGLTGPDDPRDIHAAVAALTTRFFGQYLKGRTRETTVELPSDARVRFIRHEAK